MVVRLWPPPGSIRCVFMTASINSVIDSEHRVRLLQAMAALAGARGYAGITIADIVREAGVSKRTFYEHFDGKEACFLALYRAASGAALRVLREAVSADKPWQLQVESALSSYFAHMAADPQVLKMLFVEIHQLGEPGALLRREVMQQMVDFMLSTVQPGNGPVPGAAPVVLTSTMAMAAVGGINELILQAIEQGMAGDLPRLTPTASALIRALAQAEVPDL